MKYKMLVDSKVTPDVKAGCIVYRFYGNDYGCARDDTFGLGVQCEAFTLVDGQYPFFIVPMTDVEKVD